MRTMAHWLPGVVLLLAVEANGQTTLYFPRLVTTSGTTSNPDNSDYTGLAIANLDTNVATLTFTAYGEGGSLITGAEITNPATRTLEPGGQLPIVDTQLFGPGLAARRPVAWIKAESTVSRVVGFFLAFNGSLTVLDGADVASSPMTVSILPEVEDQGFTHLHLANPSPDESGDVWIELKRNDGRFIAALIYGLRGNAASRETRSSPSDPLASLFTDVFTQPTDYIRVRSPKPIVAYEYLGKPGLYTYGLNGQDASLGARTLYAPQYVVGGAEWRSTLSVVNLEPVAGTVTFRFFRDDGTQIGSTQQRPISGEGKIYISDQSFFVNAGGTLTQGYVEITSSGPKLTGSVVFGDRNRSKFSSALPLVSTLRTSMIFSQLASNETYFTGVAILNPNTTAATARIDVYDQAGKLIATKEESIPAGQRKSQLLTQFIPALAGDNRSAGYIKLTSNVGVASFALFGTHELSVLSAVPSQAAP